MSLINISYCLMELTHWRLNSYMIILIKNKVIAFHSSDPEYDGLVQLSLVSEDGGVSPYYLIGTGNQTQMASFCRWITSKSQDKEAEWMSTVSPDESFQVVSYAESADAIHLHSVSEGGFPVTYLVTKNAVVSSKDYQDHLKVFQALLQAEIDPISALNFGYKSLFNAKPIDAQILLCDKAFSSINKVH